MAPKKNTAHRPSEAHRQWVKARNGDTVLNTAYDPSKKARPASRDLRPGQPEKKLSKRELANLVAESNDPDQIHDLVLSSGAPSVVSAAVKNPATSTATLTDIYESSSPHDIVRDKIREHPNVPLGSLDEKDFGKVLRSGNYLSSPVYSADALKTLNRDRAEQMLHAGAVSHKQHAVPPFRSLCLNDPNRIGAVTRSSSLTTDEIKGLPDPVLNDLVRTGSVQTYREVYDIAEESLHRGSKSGELRSLVLSGPRIGQGFHNREKPDPNFIDRLIVQTEEGYSSTPQMYRYATPAGRAHIEKQHPGEYDSLGRVLTAVERAGVSPKEFRERFSEEAGGIARSRSFYEYSIRVDVPALEKAGLSRDDVPALMSTSLAWNGSSRWDPDTGLFRYEIDSSG